LPEKEAYWTGLALQRVLGNSGIGVLVEGSLPSGVRWKTRGGRALATVRSICIEGPKIDAPQWEIEGGPSGRWEGSSLPWGTGAGTEKSPSAKRR
jgi:hypothetical protein